MRKSDPLYRLGMRTTVSEGVDLLSQIDDEGHIQAATVLTINPRWRLTLAVTSTAAHVTGKQEPCYGFSLQGKLD